MKKLLLWCTCSLGSWMVLVVSMPMQSQDALAAGTLFWGPSPGWAHSRVETLSEVGGLLACSFRATTVTVYSSPGFSPVWLKVVTVLGSWAITPPSLFCQEAKISVKKQQQKRCFGGTDAQRGGAPHVASSHSHLCTPKLHPHPGTLLG